jgi:hypothetical protein
MDHDELNKLAKSTLDELALKGLTVADSSPTFEEVEHS